MWGCQINVVFSSQKKKYHFDENLITGSIGNCFIFTSILKFLYVRKHGKLTFAVIFRHWVYARNWKLLLHVYLPAEDSTVLFKLKFWNSYHKKYIYIMKREIICCEITLNGKPQDQEISLYRTHIDQFLYAIPHLLATLNKLTMIE